MAREFAKDFYHSKAWRNCRESFIKYRIQVDGGMCQKCHKRLGYIIHHKIYLSPENINDPQITLNFDNLLYWCEPCHSAEHNSHKHLLCGFDEEGRPVKYANTEICD